MRNRTKRRLELAGKGPDAPEIDHEQAALHGLWNLREALRHHMAGQLLRGVRKVKLVNAAGVDEEDENRKIELAAISEATESLRVILLRGLVDELPEPPKESSLTIQTQSPLSEALIVDE